MIIQFCNEYGEKYIAIVDKNGMKICGDETDWEWIGGKTQESKLFEFSEVESKFIDACIFLQENALWDNKK